MNAQRTARGSKAVNVEVPAQRREVDGDSAETRDVESTAHVPLGNTYIVDVYTVGQAPMTYRKEGSATPFWHPIALLGVGGTAVNVMATFDDGAMVGAMCSRIFEKVKTQLGSWGPSKRRLRMADGKVVHTEAVWEGTISIAGIEATGAFEVFDSGGSWEFLFGKPLMLAFDAIHHYRLDEVQIGGNGAATTLHNANPDACAPVEEVTTPTAQAERQRGNAVGGQPEAVEQPPSRQVDIPREPVAACGEQIDQPHIEHTHSDISAPDRLRTQGQTTDEGEHNTSPDDITQQPSAGDEQGREEKGAVAEQETATAADQGTGAETEQTGTTEKGGEQRRERAQRTRTWRGAGQRRHRRFQTRTRKMARPQRARTVGGPRAPPSREVHTTQCTSVPQTTADERNPTETSEGGVNVLLLDDDEHDTADIGTDIPVDDLHSDHSGVFTRKTDPFNAACVAEVLRSVKIGDDLSADERTCVNALIAEYADVFALSVGEVLTVEGAVHKLNVPLDAKFSTKVRQKPLTPPQKQYLHEKIDEMLDAGIIEACNPGEVKCVSPTTLAQKAHQGVGLMLEELQHRVNEQCIVNGFDPQFQLPPRSEPTPDDEKQTSSPKWRVCQNFGEVNKLTEIAPMPQGDIRAKQQKLSCHRWLSLFDFASGFYAVEMAEESKPYTAFYVEGRGYFWYRRMPFGLTGAPSTFADVTAKCLHDLLVEEVIELFVDDGGMAADEFEDMIQKLTRLFTRAREKKLSISAAKSEFFVSTGIFAGASVGKNGVQPDLTKLTAIVNWPAPQDAMTLAAFLGLTGWFRDLIQGYAKVEKPLRDLLREVEMPPGCSKSVYRRVMSNWLLADRWTQEHNKSFVELKRLLTSEPVLRAPKWDGTHFIITSDGCQDAFGAVLAQQFTTELPGGKSVTKLHPLGFASKRTSRAEGKYKPFLLEFAALKFALDKFSDIVWGFPVEVVTDCQALRDVLTNDKLSATHARWRDGILAHQIVDVRHVPGKTNVVADGLSRAAEDTANTPGDGSEWTVSEDWEATSGLVHDILLVVETSDVDALRHRFADEPIFLEVVDALHELTTGKTVRERKRAKHRAMDYMVEGDRLYKISGGPKTRPKARVECITRSEATAMARAEHQNGGHWGRDAVKRRLMDTIWSPGLDASIMDGIKDCGRCKNFGGTHLHALLNPITRRHPFELLVGDYLSLPVGTGGFQTVGLYLDTYSQHVWGHKFKTAGTAKTTISSLERIFQDFAPSEALMVDGGRHFDNREVREFCGKWGTETHVVAAYSPWVNGLVEGTNKILLHVLKRLCAPNLGEDEYDAMSIEDLPKSWPKHLDEAIRILNWRMLPAFSHTPKELLLGLVVGTPKTAVEESASVLKADDVETQLAYAGQQRLDGYAAAVAHAVKRKTVFDRQVREKGGEVTFTRGQLVQVYRNDLDYTFKTERKLLPKWSAPHHIRGRLANSYTLEALDSTALTGRFSARRLREFVAREGTELAGAQAEFMEQVAREEAARTMKEEAAVAQEREDEEGEGAWETDDEED